MLGQTGGERLRVYDDLPLVIAERRLERFVKTDRFRSDDMHERPALHTGKHSGVDRFRVLRGGHDDASARAAQTFMGRGGDKLGVRNRRRVLAARDETGNVRHVDEKKSADGISNLPQARKVDDAWVG